MARGEDAFTAADSLCRLQRLQATCGALRESEGVDALLFIGGIDGRDNLGSVRCLNFLLGGVGGVELLEREQCVGKWGEDVVLLVRPDGCEIHVGHAHYEALRPFIAAWGNVEVHTLPPRHIPNEDDEAPKRPDREDEARDDDEASSDESLGGRGDGSDDSEEEEEEEDVLQDFKLTALVSMLTGVTTVGVACTPNGPGEMETERWPLLQAYGIEGVGRSGFFTMSTNVIDTWDVIHRACFTQLDGAQLRRELARSAPPFRQHWEASLATMDARRAPGRMTLTPALAFDPLTEFFAYGTLRCPVGFGAFDEADAPRVGFGLGTDDDLRGGDDDVHLENVRASAAGHARGPALHCTVEARHPKSPGLRCARTYVFGQGCVSATAINGFTKRVDDDEDDDATRDSENQSRLREPPRATDEADVAALVGLYAAAVAAGRDAMSAACDAWAAGAGPETWTRGDAVEVAVVGAARRALPRRRTRSASHRTSGRIARPRWTFAWMRRTRRTRGRPPPRAMARSGNVEGTAVTTRDSVLVLVLVSASLAAWRTFASLSAASSASRAASPSARSCTATRSSPAGFEPATAGKSARLWRRWF